MDYAPDNEQGVVFLFSKLAKGRFGLHVESVRSGYPDCIAYRHEKRIRIEFEFRSRHFLQHRHRAAGCDWIVCWIHDWPAVPQRIRVVELRREYGLGFNVWFQPVRAGPTADLLTRTNYDPRWSVASQAQEGDLLLFYRARPEKLIRDLFVVDGPVTYVRALWRSGFDWMAPIRRVCTLKAPVHLEQLRQHPIIRFAGFIRGNMRGRYKASEYWPEIYKIIVDLNPAAKRSLAHFGPDRLT